MQFSYKQPQWNLSSLELFLQKWIKNAELPQWIGSKAEEALSDWMLIQLIAKRTEVVGKLIYFPFIVWVLIAVSRLRYFDNWRTPLGLAIVISLGAILAWSCTVVLRRSAEKIKDRGDRPPGPTNYWSLLSRTAEQRRRRPHPICPPGDQRHS